MHKKKISPSKQKKSKQRKFHQVKVTSPFLLNKIMATSTTKQSRKTCFASTTKQPRNAHFTSITKQLRKAHFTTNYRIAEVGLLQS